MLLTWGELLMKWLQGAAEGSSLMAGAGMTPGWRMGANIGHPITTLASPQPPREALRVVQWWGLFTASGE